MSEAVTKPAPFDKLVEEWLCDAEVLSRRGATQRADLLRGSAHELWKAWCDWQSEALSVCHAADESGYSADHLRRLVRSKKIENVGGAGTVKIKRCDLPLKLKQSCSEKASDAVYYKEQIARSVADSG